MTAPGETWHPSVVKLSVDHETEGTVGYIYCDLFQRFVTRLNHRIDLCFRFYLFRKDKIPHDCHFTIQCSRRRPDGTCQLPIVVLHVNIPPSADPKIPTLLSLGNERCPSG